MNIEDIKRQLEEIGFKDNNVLFLDYATVLVVPAPISMIVFEMIKNGEVKLIVPISTNIH